MCLSGNDYSDTLFLGNSSSHQYVRAYIGCLLINEWSQFPDDLDGLELVYPRRDCPVDSYWFRASGMQRPNEVSPSVDGPCTWNNLPPAPELSQNAFIRALKTHLFSTVRHR